MKSGAYSILCLVTGERYVGGSKHILRRWRVHKCELRKAVHESPKLQEAWNRYGEASFKFEILEEGTNVLELEQLWLDKLRPAFNVHTQSNPVGRRHKEATREKMRGPRPSLEGNQNARGAQRSPETRAKMAAAMKGKPSKLRGRTLSAEHKAKISAAKARG